MSNYKNIKHVCFDLDGTLMDSHKTIYKTTVKTLDELNIKHNLREEELYKRIGHHFLNIFADLDITVEDFEHFINIYKGYYFNFIDYSVIYPDALELIKMLNDKDVAVSLLTTKAQDQAEKILAYFKMTQMFNYIMGRREGVKTKPSAEPLLIICSKLSLKANETLMVGDTELDIQCGKAAGALTCAVTHGYRTTGQLKFEQPDLIVKNMKELITLLE
ncbi:MAG: HAD-IA family hydrolase [Ignavibacteria bacterium]|nr:HAD-IA family hydrolase [Ignavibacteria bacterium]